VGGDVHLGEIAARPGPREPLAVRPHVVGDPGDDLGATEVYGPTEYAEVEVSGSGALPTASPTPSASS
jgi:hypothetical protein